MAEGIVIRVTSAQYQLDLLENWKSYSDKIEHLACEAKTKHSNLLLLPEYAGFEIACGQYDTDLDLYRHIQRKMPNYIDFYINICKKNDLYIQPGTIPIEVAPNQFANRAYLFSPYGQYGFQDKLQLTVYEKLSKIMTPGQAQTVFETSFGKIGIAICYDAEFPELVKPLVLAGAKLILVPSYTNSAAGSARVFYCARARAIENQCYVVTSAVVGPMKLTKKIDHCQGITAILGPADKKFPSDGMLAQIEADGTALLTADLDLHKIDWVRRHGSVRNFLDAHGCPPTITTRLSIESL